MRYKRGTSFDFSGIVRDDATGKAKDITGWTVEAQLRHEVAGAAGELIATLVGTVEDGPTGAYRVKAATISETKAWPITEAVFDIVFVTTAGARVPTEDFIQVSIIDPATQQA